MNMDLFEMLRMIEGAYIAGARGHAEWLATQRQMQPKVCTGSNLALMRKGDPVEDDSIRVTVCKDHLLVQQ